MERKWAVEDCRRSPSFGTTPRESLECPLHLMMCLTLREKKMLGFCTPMPVGCWLQVSPAETQALAALSGSSEAALGWFYRGSQE